MLSHLLARLIIFCWRLDILNIIMWQLWKPNFPFSLKFVAAFYGSSCLFSEFSELVLSSLYSLLCMLTKVPVLFPRWSTSDLTEIFSNNWNPIFSFVLIYNSSLCIYVCTLGDALSNTQPTSWQLCFSPHFLLPRAWRSAGDESFVPSQVLSEQAPPRACVWAYRFPPTSGQVKAFQCPCSPSHLIP